MKDEYYKRFLLKKELNLLKTKKGYHTELITLMIPPDRKISDVTNYLKNEINESSNIKSKLTRKNVIDSITALLQKLRTIRELPETGLVMFSGAIPQGNTQGTERTELYMVEPLERITTFRYNCSSEFLLEPLEAMLKEKQTYGVIVVDGKDSAIGWVRGSHVEVVKQSSSGVMGKHASGGQSAVRFARLHEEGVQQFFVRVAEDANDIYLPMLSEGNFDGIFIGGAGHSKLQFADSSPLDYRLKDKIIDIYDIGVSGADGIREVLNKAQDRIQNVRYVHEKKIVQQFLFNISRDTGLVAYGEKEVRRALERNAVDKLLLSEGLKLSRITITCPQCNYTEKKTVKNSDIDSFQNQMKNTPCSQCNSILYNVSEIRDVIEELGEITEASGADVEMISTETEEGEMLTSTFGGIAALLRYKLN